MTDGESQQELPVADEIRRDGGAANASQAAQQNPGDHDASSKRLAEQREEPRGVGDPLVPYVADRRDSTGRDDTDARERQSSR
jgi:hypothetical protein